MALGAPFAPSSSPPSSPSWGPTDSSPASSPALAPIILNSPPILAGPSHPFAGSFRSDRHFQAHERRIATPAAISPSDNSDFIPRAGSCAFQRSYEEDAYLHDAGSGRLPNSVPDSREVLIWDDAISNAIDKGSGTIELRSRELTYIPGSIGDLGKFFVSATRIEQANSTGGRLFSRTKTTPISTSHQTRLFERTTSISESSMAREELQLYLAANIIRTLPRELFSLTKMTVLSLRGNQLTSIPAEISYLSNLRELNISNNQLAHIPSEMLNMALQILSLFPNPFRSEPRASPFAATPRQAGLLHRRRSMTRVLSKMAPLRVSAIIHTHPQSNVPSLFELCLRVLVSPCLLPIAGANVNLAELYALPIPGEWGSKILPSSVKNILNACVPESVSAPQNMSPSGTPRGRDHFLSSSRGDTNKDNEIMGVGTCPNTSHRSKTVFVQHMEERFTWEKVVAGVDVGDTVPVKWRGCLKGCLAFLDSLDNDKTSLWGPNVQQRQEDRIADSRMMANVDDDVEMEDSAVQPVSLARNGFGEQDFEDDA